MLTTFSGTVGGQVRQVSLYLNPRPLKQRHHEPFKHQDPHNMAPHPRRFELSTFTLMNMDT